MGVMEGLGLRPNIVERPSTKGEAIPTACAVFPTCRFDERACEQHMRRLRHYRKEWDDERGV
jgi:hypothetical protein